MTVITRVAVTEAPASTPISQGGSPSGSPVPAACFSLLSCFDGSVVGKVTVAMSVIGFSVAWLTVSLDVDGVGLFIDAFVYEGEKLTIITRGWAKYRDLSAASRSITNYWCARHWQMTIFCDNRVQWLFYHSTTVAFSVFSLFFWSTKDVKSVSDSSWNRSAIFTQDCGFNYAWAGYYLQQNTYL